MDYEKVFNEAKAELAKLQAARTNVESHLADVDAKIGAMTVTYNAIAPLVGERPIPTLKDTLISIGIDTLQAAGISIAVRAMLDSSPNQNFTASIVREQLAAKGWNWQNYKNPLPTIHTTLVRLAESGAAKEAVTTDGNKCFYSSKRIVIPDEPIGPHTLSARGTPRHAAYMPASSDPMTAKAKVQRYGVKKEEEK